MHGVNVLLGNSGLTRVDAERIVGIVSKRRSRRGLEFLVNVVPCMGRVADSTDQSPWSKHDHSPSWLYSGMYGRDKHEPTATASPLIKSETAPCRDTG
jgi:hypothetical protein